MRRAEVDIGPLADFPEGGIRILTVEGEEIGVSRWNGRLYAARNVCPHALGPVCRGRLVARLEADGSGDPVADGGRPTLTCAWHGWEFDLETGISLFEPAYRLKLYPVRAQAGRVILQLGRERRVD